MTKIECFGGEYRFLSNFFPVEVFDAEGNAYPTVEHAFQACKAEGEADRAFIATAPSPGEAKRRGRRVRMREDWDARKIEVMRGLLREKFLRGTPLADRLLATGDAELIEGNSWGDTFWGVCRGVGQNWLGKLLMERREELKG